MLIYDFKKIGNRLLKIRKKQGFTQSEVAESAGMSDRTYADIERSNVNMRVETLLQICNAVTFDLSEFSHTLTKPIPANRLFMCTHIHPITQNTGALFGLLLYSIFRYLVIKNSANTFSAGFA